MPTAPEEFIIFFYLGLFALLGLGICISLIVIIRRRALGSLFSLDFLRGTILDMSKPLIPENAPKKAGISEKLGERVVRMMVDVASSDKRDVVKDRIMRIRAECERLNTLNLPEENKRIISSVLIWAKRFDVDRHMNEMKIYRHSTQIVYDAENRDFKLRVTDGSSKNDGKNRGRA